MTDYSNSYPRTYSAIIFLVCSILLFLGAIGLFIWLLVDAAQEHFVKNILYGAAFLAITFGVLIYSLTAYKAPRTAAGVLWVAMGLGIATFIVGICLKTPPSTINLEHAQPVPVSGLSVNRLVLSIPASVDA